MWILLHRKLHQWTVLPQIPRLPALEPTSVLPGRRRTGFRPQREAPRRSDLDRSAPEPPSVLPGRRMGFLPRWVPVWILLHRKLHQWTVLPQIPRLPALEPTSVLPGRRRTGFRPQREAPRRSDLDRSAPEPPSVLPGRRMGFLPRWVPLRSDLDPPSRPPGRRRTEIRYPSARVHFSGFRSHFPYHEFAYPFPPVPPCFPRVSFLFVPTRTGASQLQI